MNDMLAISKLGVGRGLLILEAWFESKMAEGPVKTLTQALERVKGQIRARVEHPFHVVKNLFGHKKTRYKGLAKNKVQLYSLFGLANLVLAKKRLMALQAAGIGAP